MCVCAAVFASGPWQHSRERNGAWAAAHPRRDTDPVGRRDCQDHSDREGQRHTTGESGTTSLKTVDRGDPSYHLFNKYCFRFSLGLYSKDNLVDFNMGLYVPNNLGVKLQIGRFFFLNCSCYAVGMPVLDGSQVVPISKHLDFFRRQYQGVSLVQESGHFCKSCFNARIVKTHVRVTLTCFLNNGSSSDYCGVT